MTCTRDPPRDSCRTFLGAANLLLGYKTPRGVRFNHERPAQGGIAPREVVAVLRPEEVELCADEAHVRSNFVGHGTIEEILFAGAVERLRVRMASDGPVPVAPARDGAAETGSLLEVSRTLPEQRMFPVTPGQRIAVGARNHPHPADADLELYGRGGHGIRSARSSANRRCSSTLGCAHADARHAARRRGSNSRRPACLSLRRGPAVRKPPPWQLRHGAVQLLCVPPREPLPSHVLIHMLDRRIASRHACRRSQPVAARAGGSRLSRHPRQRVVREGTRRCACATCSMRAPSRSPNTASTCALNCAPATWRLSCRASWPLHPHSMLVLGTSNADALQLGLARAIPGRRVATRGTDRERRARRASPQSAA